MSSSATCPVHKNVHHKNGPCKAALALRQGNRGKNRAPSQRPAVSANTRPRERNSRPVPKPARTPARRLPEVDWTTAHDILGAPATAVSTYSLRSDYRTTIHPQFVGVKAVRFKISWLSYVPERNISGRIWILVAGSNEPAPTVNQLKAHSDGFSFNGWTDGEREFKIGKYEARLLKAAQDGHHYGGVRIHYVEELTHTTATTVCGKLKISAHFTYEAHADL